MEGGEETASQVVDRQNALQPHQFYRDLKLRGHRSVQLIPCVQYDENGRLTADSITAEQWGCFLNAVFDLWVREDINKISVQLFTKTLKAWCADSGAFTPPENVICKICDMSRLCRATHLTAAPTPQERALCAGYKAFFRHSAPYMRVMRDLIKQHRSPWELMAMLRL